MIRNPFKQTGSAHVVIIVILVIALLGALSLVFWQNFINKTESKQDPTSQTKPVEDDAIKAEKLTESYVIPKEDLSFNYPKTWELKTIYTNKESNIGENRALLISPNNFALQIAVPSYGPSWQFGERPMTCPFDEGYKGVVGDDANHDNHPDACPFYKELLSEKLANLDGLSIMAFERSSETTDIAPTSTNLTLVKTGCKMPENDLCERPSAKAGFYLDVNGGYYEKISDEDKSTALINTGHTNTKEIKASDFLKSQDVLTVIAILKSMKY